MANVRINRINASMQSAIMETIRNLQDPRVGGAIISVLKVDTTNDLSHANVFISIFTSKDVESTFNAIKNSTPYIRRQVAKKINLRAMPELHFKLDDSLDYADKIETLLKKIKK
jgi:ribosome-binding factor A